MVYGNRGIPVQGLIGKTSFHAGGGVIQFWDIRVSRTQPFSCYFSLCLVSPPAAIMSFLDHPSARDAGGSSVVPSPAPPVPSSWTIAEPARDFCAFYFLFYRRDKKKYNFFFLIIFNKFQITFYRNTIAHTITIAVCADYMHLENFNSLLCGEGFFL